MPMSIGIIGVNMINNDWHVAQLLVTQYVVATSPIGLALLVYITINNSISITKDMNDMLTLPLTCQCLLVCLMLFVSIELLLQVVSLPLTLPQIVPRLFLVLC